MTETKISNATDAELDALAAEHVKGWRLVSDLWAGNRYFSGWVDGNNAPRRTVSSWSPTTDGGDCFNVIYKMRKDGFSREVTDIDDGCICLWSHDRLIVGGTEVEATNESELRATVEAAVMAKMGEHV